MKNGRINCPKKECECKTCFYNKVCIACDECIEHKYLQPVINCGNIKLGSWYYFSVANINSKYFMCIADGAVVRGTLYKISKNEFDSFDEWKNDDSVILNILNRITK